MDYNDLEHRFAFHPALTPKRRDDHEKVRDRIFSLAWSLDDVVPEGREKALMVTKLEEAMFWANAAIARQKED